MWSLGVSGEKSFSGWMANSEDGGLEGKAHSIILFLPVEFVKVLFLPLPLTFTPGTYSNLGLCWVFSYPSAPAKIFRELEFI